MPKLPTAVICLSAVNGGMELAAIKLARLLSTAMPIHFIVKEGGFIAGECSKHFGNEDIRLHAIDFKRFFSLKLINLIRRYVKQHNIKNVIFLGASEMRSLYFAFKGLDINLIIRQGSKKSTPKKDPLHKLVYSEVHAFVGNCDYMKANIEQIYPLRPTTKLKRIYSSLQFQEAGTNKQDSDQIELISVGRINPVKGQLASIQACQLLYENNINFRLRLLGNIQDNAYYSEINDFLNSCAYKNRIEFTGYKSNIPEYLKQSDIFLFPSRGEGMSNAVIEALGYGLIPLIYDNTSAPEISTLGFHIHLIEDQNTSALSQKLLDVCLQLAEEKQKAKQNISLARDIFSPEQEKAQYLELLV